MSYKSTVDKILQQNLTRKQFVSVMLSAFASLFGISTFLGILTKGPKRDDARPGYGDQKYGP